MNMTDLSSLLMAKKHPTRNVAPDSLSSLKLSKAFSQYNPLSSASSGRASLAANHTKVNNKIRKAVSGQYMSKKPCFGDSGAPFPEPTSLRFQIAFRDLSGSVCGQITSTDKSPTSLRRKNDFAASSKARTPSRSLTGHKSKQTDSSQPTNLQSTPKSSSTSLSNSIDGCPLESPASGRKRLDTAFNRGVPVNNDVSQGTDTENCCSDKPFVQSGSKETRLPCQDVERFSKGSCALALTISRERKPSGLRMPSPKIGFFDVENSRELTPNGGLKFHSGVLNTSKARSGTNHLNGTPNRARNGKLQTPRKSTRSVSIKEKKLGSQQTGTQSSRGVNPNFAPQLEGEKTCQEFKSSAAIGKAETDLSCESSDGYVSKTDGLGSYLKGEDKDEIRPESKEFATLKKPSLDQNEDTSALTRGDKENLFSFKNQVDVLTKQIEAISVKRELLIEF